MSTIVVSSERELQRLYGRYKALALATSAALMLERPVDHLAAETAVLCGESRAAVDRDDDLVVHFGACAAAADDLSELLQLAAQGRSTLRQLERVRASHVRLRRNVWTVQPCEYVPCCAPEAHNHREGRDA